MTSCQGRTNVNRPVKTLIRQCCADTGCRLNDFSGAMINRYGWRERDRQTDTVCVRVCGCVSKKSERSECHRMMIIMKMTCSKSFQPESVFTMKEDNYELSVNFLLVYTGVRRQLLLHIKTFVSLFIYVGRNCLQWERQRERERENLIDSGTAQKSISSESLTLLLYLHGVSSWCNG